MRFPISFRSLAPINLNSQRKVERKLHPITKKSGTEGKYEAR